MKMNKTLASLLSGALAGSLVSCVIMFSFTGEKAENKNTDTVNSESYKMYSVSENTNEKKVLSVEEIAKKVGPSVVGITCKTVTQGYFGSQTGEAMGSGFIISDKGEIVTNYHVIEDGQEIKVKLTSGNEYPAKIVGGDKRMDIAVLKIDAKEELHVASIGNSDELEVGSLAVAIGNPLARELFGTVTAGVISGVNRSMTIGNREMNLIQTDAAISPGNSGGALINKYGEVIGINSVKLVDTAAEGIGFAIPMNEAAPVIKDLIKYGYVKGRPVIGVSVREINPELAYYNNLLIDHGLYVMSVGEGSGAYRAGLTRGDIILKADGKAVNTTSELNKIRDKHKAGESISMVVLRGGKEINLSVTLGEDVSSKKQ